MTIFISIKYYKNKENQSIIHSLKEIIKEAGHTPYCFLDEPFVGNSREMMNMAFEKISFSHSLRS